MKLILKILLVAMFSACELINNNFYQTKSLTRSDGVCDVLYDKIRAPNIRDVSSMIVDEGIDFNAKVRHLNELNLLPKKYLSFLKSSGVKILFAKNRITDMEVFANYENSAPRNWNNGSTFRDVPGVYLPWVKSVLLSAKSSATSVWSLALHETAHALDDALKLTKSSDLLSQIFKTEKDQKKLEDKIRGYRFGNPEEHFAVAVDEYYCSSKSRQWLKNIYPLMYDFIDKKLEALID